MGKLNNRHHDKRDTIFIDVDGVIVKHNYDSDSETFLESTIQYLMDNSDKCIILTTSRTVEQVESVMFELKSRGIPIDGLIANLPTGKRTLINDFIPGNADKAIAINLVRDQGM